MKKIISFILLLCIVLSLSACGKEEITMQDVYNAVQTEALLKTTKAHIFGTNWTENFLMKNI